MSQRIEGVAVSIIPLQRRQKCQPVRLICSREGRCACVDPQLVESSWGLFGVCFGAVSPGFIDTPSTRAALSGPSSITRKKRIPLRRLGEPEAVTWPSGHFIERLPERHHPRCGTAAALNACETCRHPSNLAFVFAAVCRQHGERPALLYP